MLKKLFFVSLFFIWCSSAFAANYYVDTATGDNGNAGSAALPVKEMARAEAIASNTDTVYVKSGNYQEPTTASAGSGCFTSAKAITWLATSGWNGDGSVTTAQLAAGSVVITAYSGTVGAYMNGNTTTSFTGFTVTSPSAYGVLTSGAIGTKTWTRSVFTGGTSSAFDLFTGSGGTVSLVDCTINHANGIGLNLRGGGTSVTLTNTSINATGSGTSINLPANHGTVSITGGTHTRDTAGYFVHVSAGTTTSLTVANSIFTNYIMSNHALIYMNTTVTALSVSGITATVDNGYIIYSTAVNAAGAITLTNSTMTQANDNLNMILILNTGIITMTGNTFNVAREGNTAGIAIQLAAVAADCGDLVFNNNTINNTGYSTSGHLLDIRNRFDDIEIKRNVISSTHTSSNSNLISIIDGKAPVITDNVITGVTALAEIPINITQVDGATATTSVATIARNKIYSKSKAGYYIAIGAEATSTGDNNYDGSIIERNEIYGTNSYGVAATSVHSIFFGFNVKGFIRYNYVNGGYYGAVIKSDAFDWEHTGGVYGNIFVNNNYIGVYNKGSVNLDIFNNTIYSNATYKSTEATIFVAENGANASSGTEIYNNILSVPKAEPLINVGSGDTTNVVISNNLYFNPDGTSADTSFAFGGTSYTTFATWSAAASDTNSAYAHPAFKGSNVLGLKPLDLSIDCSSPARNKGITPTTTGVSYKYDLFYNPIPKGVAYDCGASEPSCKKGRGFFGGWGVGWAGGYET